MTASSRLPWEQPPAAAFVSAGTAGPASLSEAAPLTSPGFRPEDSTTRAGRTAARPIRDLAREPAR